MTTAPPVQSSYRFSPEMLQSLAGLQFRARYVVEGFLSGMHQSPFHGYSVEFDEYRDYQPGDDLRHLDWRLYARADKLCIKRFEQETNLNFHVILDSSASMAYRGARAWASKIEYGSLVAACLTSLLLKQKDAVSLLTFEVPPRSLLGGVGEGSRAEHEAELRYIQPSSKPSQFGRVLGLLENLPPSGGPCLGRLLDNARRMIPRRGVILLVSDLLDPSETVAEQLKQLHFLGHEIIVFHVLDDDEIDFPFEESQVFEDLESGVRRRIRPAQVRAAYLKRFGDFLEEYAALFAGLKIGCTRMATTGDPSHALAFFLAERKLHG